jgi:hypothetical protein
MSMRALLKRAGGLMAAAAGLLPTVAEAQDGLFRTRAQIYGWALVSPALEFATENLAPAAGRMTGPQADGSVRVGRFGLWSDAVSLGLDGGRHVIPGLVDPMFASEAGVRPRGLARTVAGTYAAVETPRVDLYTLAGLRQFRTDGGFDARLLSWSGAPLQRPDAWDAILGVRGRVKLGEGRWFAPYYLDVGTGQSDFTWQAYGGIGYAFSWGGEVVGSWRHLDYNFATGSRMHDLSFSGPSISFGIRW